MNEDGARCSMSDKVKHELSGEAVLSKEKTANEFELICHK